MSRQSADYESKRNFKPVFLAAYFKATTLGTFTQLSCLSAIAQASIEELYSRYRMKGRLVAVQPFNVLFLCTGNSARSILAEAILQREGIDKFKAHSAGSNPKGKVHPFALHLLQTLNHPVTQLRSKSWDEFAVEGAPRLDFVFTVCDNAANEVCPIWPGQPMTAHWGLPDPAAAEGSEVERHLAFAETYRMLKNRISIFVNLPMSSLDRLSLQRKLSEIGKA